MIYRLGLIDFIKYFGKFLFIYQRNGRVIQFIFFTLNQNWSFNFRCLIGDMSNFIQLFFRSTTLFNFC